MKTLNKKNLIFSLILLTIFALGAMAFIPANTYAWVSQAGSGAVGNAITDGIAGVFEGHIAERLRQKNIS